MVTDTKNLTGMTEEDMGQLDWIMLKKDMDKLMPTETQSEKFMKKFKENPFVPIGAAATTAALFYGIWSFRNGERKMSQYMMRTRIVAQGLTVMALVVGIGITAKKNAFPE